MITLARFPADDCPRLGSGAAWVLANIAATIAIRKAVAKSTRRLLRGHRRRTISRTMQVKWLVGQNRSNCLKDSMQRIHPLMDQTQHLKSSFKSSVSGTRRSVNRPSSALRTCKHIENSSSGNIIGGQKRNLPANGRWAVRNKVGVSRQKVEPTSSSARSALGSALLFSQTITSTNRKSTKNNQN
jgi:hypothetical protein